MIIVKTPEEELFETEGYGFFLGDVGKFIARALPATVGGLLVTGGSPVGAIAGAATGFIGGEPSKVLKRFLYGVGAGGAVAGITSLVAPQYQSYVQGPLSSKISEALSKIKTSIPGMSGGEVQTVSQIKEGISSALSKNLTLAEKLKLNYFTPELGLTEKIESTVLPHISVTTGAGSSLLDKFLVGAKEFIKTGIESLAKTAVAQQIAGIVAAQMQYPTTPFQVYQMPEGPIVYEPQSDTLIVPKPVVQQAVQEVSQEQAMQKTKEQALQIAKQHSETAKNLTEEYINMGINPQQALQYALNPVVQDLTKKGLSPKQALEEYLSMEKRKKYISYAILLGIGGLIIILIVGRK